MKVSGIEKYFACMGESFYFAVVTISLPTMVGVTEGDGTVEVCATISTASDVPINITLTTNDSSPGVYYVYVSQKINLLLCMGMHWPIDSTY